MQANRHGELVIPVNGNFFHKGFNNLAFQLNDSSLFSGSFRHAMQCLNALLQISKILLNLFLPINQQLSINRILDGIQLLL